MEFFLKDVGPIDTKSVFFLNCSLANTRPTSFMLSLISMDMITNWYNSIYSYQQKFWMQFWEELDQRGVKNEGQFITVQRQIELTGILSHGRKGKKK